MKIKNLGANKTELTLTGKVEAVIFFSYETPVAAFVHGKAYRTDKFYSVTTSKHINQWLGHLASTAIKETPEFFQNLVA